MKLIKPNVVILEQQPGLDGMYKQIELVGRTCYKSEDMITYNTIHDKNKDEYTIDSVTITPRDGEKKYLSKEEFFKSLVR